MIRKPDEMKTELRANMRDGNESFEPDAFALIPAAAQGESPAMPTPPVTYFFEFEFCTDRIRPYIMAEFAANGAQHLVLNSTLIRMIMHSPALAKVLQREMEASGLRFADAHAPFGDLENLNVPDPACRGAMLDRQRLALRIAADFGVDSITLHTGNMWAGHTLEQLHETMITSLETLVPLAEELGVTIAIENIMAPTNTPEKLLDALRRVPSPNLGVCYDSGHAHLMACDRHLDECTPASRWHGHGPVQWDGTVLEKLLAEITTCHIHDNHGQFDSHLVPGRGTIDWTHVTALLKTAPRLKYIQCEASPVHSNGSIADICKAMKHLFPGR